MSIMTIIRTTTADITADTGAIPTPPCRFPMESAPIGVASAEGAFMAAVTVAAAPTESVLMAVVSAGAVLLAVFSMGAALLAAVSAGAALLVVVPVVGIASSREPAWSVYVPVAAIGGFMPPNRAKSKTLK